MLAGRLFRFPLCCEVGIDWRTVLVGQWMILLNIGVNAILVYKIFLHLRNCSLEYLTRSPNLTNFISFFYQLIPLLDEEQRRQDWRWSWYISKLDDKWFELAGGTKIHRKVNGFEHHTFDSINWLLIRMTQVVSSLAFLTQVHGCFLLLEILQIVEIPFLNLLYGVVSLARNRRSKFTCISYVQEPRPR